MDTPALALGALTDDALTGDYRVWQRARGHRYSIDDVTTAWEAANARPQASRVCDLGCGIGSVALMLAWKLPGAQVVGLEAQEISLSLAHENVERNALSSRVRLEAGDLRDPAARARLGGPFELVTGTPPYFAPGDASASPDSQRAYARIELRGGVEAYLEAMGALLSDTGRAVVCADARKPERVIDGAAAAGLFPSSRRDVVPRAGKDALFAVWVLSRDDETTLVTHPALTLRDEGGVRTEEERAIRRFFGLAPPEHELPSPPRRPPAAVNESPDE